MPIAKQIKFPLRYTIFCLLKQLSQETGISIHSRSFKDDYINFVH